MPTILVAGGRKLSSASTTSKTFRTNKPSARAGRIAGNLVIGMSYGYWMDKHTKHHANPNHDDLDPDVRAGTAKQRGLEAGLLAAHFVFYLGALLLVLSPLQALAFLVVHQALFGIYLGLTFAPHHKGMPHPDGTEDFLRKQVLTSRNVRGSRFVDAALGGLNYQIEHHLFPALPTPNLRKAQPMRPCGERNANPRESPHGSATGRQGRRRHRW